MKKIIIITGLTCTGKTDLAVKIAKQFNGEIISADSVQIYKGLDIASAKDLEAIKQVKHHLIDIKEFNESYNVGEFISDVENALNKITEQGKLPIIVGGTAMYIKALMEGYSLGNTTANFGFRNFYQNMAKTDGNMAVWNELYKLNPKKANSVHSNNIKRVIRYLEIEKFGSPVNEKSILENYSICAVGIVADRQLLYEKINNRVDNMIKQGLENEIKNLIKAGATRDMQSMNTIGYREWFDYFSGKTNKDETIDLIKQHSRNYAKRQLTFLKTIKNVELLNISDAEKKIKEFIDD